jgi:glycosyltransferase involved in cell wall biosynthesis
MRILTITNWYPPHHRGGYEANCADVMNRLAARGHHVEVLCSDERLAGVEDGSEPVPVRREVSMYWRDERPWEPSVRGQLAIERANQAALLRALDELKPDVVFAWHMAAFSLNLLTTVNRRGLPIVYAICDAWPSYTLLMDPWARRFRGPLRRVAGRAVERALHIPAVLPELDTIGNACFVSRFTRDDVRENSPWQFPDAHIVASGIDRNVLAAPEHPTARDGWRGRLAYLGRFDARKGTDTLLAAMRLLPDTTLAMFGRGGDSERRRLVELATDLGVVHRVSFGSLDPTEVGTAYREADCVVFPSEWPEPFGLVPLEAMECGTPVVATGTGGSADFLDHDVNCLLFEPSNPSSLAGAVTRLATDPHLRHSLIEAGYRTARHYDVDHMAASYEQHLRAAASKPALPRSSPRNSRR